MSYPSLVRGSPVQLFLSLIEAVRQVGPGRWMGRCPAHDDRSPSLSISEGDDGQALVYCHAGCDLASILNVLGIEKRDLFPPREGHAQRAQSTRRVVAKQREPDPPKAEIEAISPVTKEQIRALREYGYGFGAELYREAAAFAVSIKNLKTGKTRTALGFLGFAGFGDRWKVWEVSAQGRLWIDKESGKLVRRNYGPADLIVAHSLWNFSPIERLTVVEGESDLLACLALGKAAVLTTTCGAMNTTAFEHRDVMMWLRYKKPRKVFVYGDNDDAGRAGAEKRAEVLKGILPEARIFLPRLPEPVNDFRDLIGGGNRSETNSI